MFQDVTLFDNTILENIRLGRKGATDEEVLAAAKLANCEEFAENVCDEFFSLPLFPQSSCAFEEVGGASHGETNGATATAATGGSYACGCVSAGKTPTASTCSHCGTTCLSGQGSLCPRCGCTMTSVS